MIEPNELAARLAYLAGFFDGEGYVGVYLSKNRRTCTFEVVVAQNDVRPLQLFQEMFPKGRIVHHANNIPKWKLSGREALMDFCELLIPFSVVKREQLEHMLVNMCWSLYRFGGNTTDLDAMIAQAIHRESKQLKQVKNQDQRTI